MALGTEFSIVPRTKARATSQKMGRLNPKFQPGRACFTLAKWFAATRNANWHFHRNTFTKKSCICNTILAPPCLESTVTKCVSNEREAKNKAKAQTLFCIVGGAQVLKANMLTELRAQNS